MKKMINIEHPLFKIAFLSIFILLNVFAFGQGTETFSNIPTTSSTSYLSRSWTGDDGSTWTATNARTDQTINGKAICLNDDVADTYVQSGTISGGVGNISVTVKMPYADVANAEPPTLYINGTPIGTLAYTAAGETTTFNGVNISGDIIIKIDNSGLEGRLAFDDITWTAYAGSSNDTDSEASTPGAQQTGGSISSLADTDGEAVDVFKFDIDDLSTGDTEDTKVTNIRIKPAGSNTADWTDHIQGVKLNNGSPVTIGSPTITDTYIDIPITSGNLDVSDGASETITMSIYLNTSNIVDGAVLSFMIDADNNGFTADAAGSTFAGTFTGGDVTSNDFTIAVVATELIFTSSTPPSTGVPSTNFTVEVSAVDANGNIDTDATNSVTLTGESGSGTLYSATGLTQSLSSGVYEWTDCQFDATDTYQVTATTTGLSDNNVTSGNIVIAISADYIIISEVCDPTNEFATDRYVEIYNPTSSTIDLTGCELEIWVNGAYLYTFSLSGTIASCTAMSFGDVGSVNYTPDVAEAWTTTSFNGDATDGAKFKNSSGTVIDVAIGNSFENSSAVRNSNISTPTATFNSSEWTVTAVTDAGSGASTPGTHICNTCGNDYDSEASAPTGGQQAGSTISSLADTDGEAVNVFKFDIDDIGSGDGVDTKVTNIRIIPAGSNTADWTDHIQGVKLNNGSPVTIGSPTITDTYIDIPITSGNLDVADGASATITMSLYLNTSNIVDGAVLSFMIDADNNNFDADVAGSTFASTFTGGDVTSNDFTIAVVATQLLYVQQPTNTIVNQAMSPNPTVSACDANGNIDTDYSTAITVASDGTMTGDPVSGSWSSGIATFSSLTHTVTGTAYRLTAASGVLTNAISSTFDITDAPSIFISELAAYGTSSGTFNDEYIELVNSGVSTQSLNGWQLLYYESGSLEKTLTFGASDEITANSTFVIAVRTSYTGAITPDYVPASSFSMNNSSFYVILKDASSNIMDQAGTSSTGFTTDKNYEFTDCGADNEPVAAWDPLNTADGTPGVVNCACSYPTTQASGLTLTKLSGTSVQVDWTTGNGDYAIVVVHEEAAVNTDPTSGVSYSADSDFSGSPDEIGTGNFVVYNGTGTTVTVTGLTTDLYYYFAVYEYNSADDCYNTTEITTGISMCTNQTIPFSEGFNSTSIPSCWAKEVVADPGTDPAITFQASNTYPSISSPQEGTQFVKFNSYNCSSGAEMRLISPPITTTGLSSLNMDFIWYESPNYSTYLTEGMTVQYSLNGGSTWTDIAFYQRYNAVDGWKDKTCPLPAAINNQASVLIGFLFHSQYGYDCIMDDVYIYTCDEPTTNPTTLTFTNVTSSGMDIEIGTPGDGTSRIIVAREGAAVSFTPTDLTTYEANNVFTDATDLGSGNKIIYNGTGTTVSLSGLIGGTTYYFAVYEYNCIAGYENYYTGGTILVDNETTSLSPVTNLHVVCQSSTTADIAWTAPTGDYDGVIIGVRNSTLVPHSISADANTYTADAAFMSGTLYGTTDPRSYVVYKGTGTSVTVTGLTAGQDYSIKGYAFKGTTSSVWASTQPTTAINGLGTVDVTGNFVLTDNAQLQLQWSNPDASCFDEVLIVGNAGSAITTAPTGDGSTYTGNTVFGSGTPYGTGYVVYKGSFSPQTITNLTNGVEYCFTWFVRNGTSWSAGVSGCGTPAAITILEPGDLAIVAVNTQATSSGSADEICFFAFQDITEGTSIDFTDNGYERLYEGLWASSEGTLRWTRSGGGTITAGKVICFQGAGYLQSQFSIFTCGVADDANWTLSSLNSVGSTHGSYDLNVDDQIWIIQGGAWDNGGSSLSDHVATYSGNVLYGWTATGWFDNPGYDDTHGSTLYPETECFNTNVSVAENHSKVKYIGATTTTSQFNWLGRINDSGNWLGYVDNTAYYAGPDYTGTCFEFISDEAISGVAGVWTGASGTEDWFNCGNWQNLRIPRGSHNVLVSGTVSNHITVDDGIPSMPEAECNNLTITSDANVGGSPVQLKVNHADAVLNIYGNFSNDQIITHTAGEIHYQGNFTNNDTYTHNTAGTAFFDGSGAQELTGATTFYNLTMNNSSSGLTLNNDVTINNTLTFTDGLINTSTSKIIIENNSTSAITGHSTDGYVNGNLRRKVAATGSYDLPVGTSANYEIANIDLTTSTITYLDAKFTNPHSGTTLPTTPYLSVNGTDVTTMLDYGFWTISPVAGDATDYDVTLTSRGHTNGGTDPAQHTIVKRADAASAWAVYESNHDNSTQTGSGTSPITAKLTAMSGFSDMAIARSTINPLPVELLSFKAELINNEVELNWTTATEINNAFFSLEKSKDGINFIEFASVLGAGNSNEIIDYSYLDEDPYSGLSYYRLKQVDYDGKFEYSDIVSIINNDENKLSILNAYSYEQALSVSVYNPAKEELNIRITDMTGRIIYIDKLNSKSERIMINISQGKLSSGIYNLTLFNNYEATSQRVLIH